MRNQILIFILILFVSSCVPEESKNDLDPSNICGGISSNAVGMKVSSSEAQNAVYESDGIHFDLYTSIQNCFGKQVNSISPVLISASGSSINSALSPNISSLNKDASSGLLNLGNLVFNPSTSSTNFIVRLNSSLETKDDSSSINLASMKPDFVVDTATAQISDGASLSNGDVLLDPGESLSFNFKVSNLSYTKIKSLSATISSSNSNFVISSGSSVSFGDLSSKSSLTTATPTIINISSSATRGSSGTLTITLIDQYSHTWTKNITLTVSPTVPLPRKTQVLSLPSNMTFKGFTADSTKWYVLVYESLGNSVNYWRIYQKGASGTSFTHVCSILDDGQIKGHLAVDASYFYVGQSSSIRKLNKSTCASESTISPSNGLNSLTKYFNDSYYAYRTYLAVDSGKLYYSNSSTALSSYNLSSTATASFTIDQSLGAKIFNDSYGLFTVFSGIRWAFDNYNEYIWKFDSNNVALAWAALPTLTYPDLEFVKSIATQNGNVLILANEKNIGTIKFRSVDISGWEDYSGQTLITNGNEEIITLGVSNFSGCQINEYVNSSQKCFSLTARQATTLSTSTFKGFTADQDYLYLMTSDSLNNWTIFRRTQSQSSWTSLCSLNTTELKGHLAVDSNYFYVTGINYVKKLNKTNCSIANSIYIPSLNYYSQFFNSSNYGYKSFLSVDSGKIYHTGDSFYLGTFDLSSSATMSSTLIQSIGEKSYENEFGILVVKNGIRWSVNKNTLWNIDTGNIAKAWGALPNSTYDELNYVKSVATQDGNTLILATEKTIGTVVLYYFDVSNF